MQNELFLFECEKSKDYFDNIVRQELGVEPHKLINDGEAFTLTSRFSFDVSSVLSSPLSPQTL